MKIRSWLVVGGVFLVLLAPLPAAAEMCESTGEYEYTYGDNESIMQAKQRCEGLALRAAIEQCALFVSSTTNIENYELRDDLVNTIAAALVKNKKILAQRVEGRTIYYKVSIKLDDEQMSRAIEAEQARRAPAQPQSQAQPPAAPVEERAQPAARPAVKTEEPARAATSVPKVKERVARPAGSLRHRLSLQLGQKTLKKADWEPVEKQPGFGLHYDTALGGLPLALSLDYRGSSKDGTLDAFGDHWKVEGTTAELTAGLRYDLPLGERFGLYAGGGLGIIAASQKLSSNFFGTFKSDGSAVGPAFSFGADVQVASTFFLGLDLRTSSAKVKMKGDSEFDAAAGGTGASLTLGWRW